MWLAVKKIILALLLPIIGFFSFPAGESPPQTIPPALMATGGPAVPQPGMPQGSPAATPSVTSATISAKALKQCLAKADQSGQCLNEIFREFVKTYTIADALLLIRHYEAIDTELRLSCHPVVHAIGRETFRLTGTVQDSFAACDQTCHSGCYHGAMERFLRGDATDDDAGHISPEELKAKAASACDSNQPTRFRFQCLHGLGHALLFFSDYRLEEALSACDALGNSWSRSSCYGGLFMENVFSATPEKRDLHLTDYHYPCSKLDSKYQGDCYMMQTTRMTEMGLPTQRLFEECRTAGEYQYTCMQSIGRDLSNDARIKDPRLTSERCEIGQGEERRACIRGVVYALIDNTWDGRYALPFCDAFTRGEDASYCFTASIGYLRGTFEKSAGEIVLDCNAHLREPQTCLAVVNR